MCCVVDVCLIAQVGTGLVGVVLLRDAAQQRHPAALGVSLRRGEHASVGACVHISSSSRCASGQVSDRGSMILEALSCSELCSGHCRCMCWVEQLVCSAVCCTKCPTCMACRIQRCESVSSRVTKMTMCLHPSGSWHRYASWASVVLAASRLQTFTAPRPAAARCILSKVNGGATSVVEIWPEKLTHRAGMMHQG